MKTNKRLLIVDDEPEALKGYEQFLLPKKKTQTRRSSRTRDKSVKSTHAIGESDSEFELIKASSGEEAIHLFHREKEAKRPIAAGFFDVKLGAGMDGLEVIREIKAKDRNILCVVVTAYQDRSVDDLDQFFGEDFKDRWDFLSKPFTQGEIVQKRDRWLLLGTERFNLE